MWTSTVVTLCSRVLVQFSLVQVSRRARPWSLGAWWYIYIYILFVTTANLWPPRSLRIYTRIYTYIYIYFFFIHIYQYQSGLCCTTSPACTLLGYVHGSSAVFCLASVGHAGVADRLHLEVVKQPAKYIVCCRCVPSGDSGQALYKAASLRPRP